MSEAGSLLPRRLTADGWSVLRIHHGSIPDYDYHAATQGLTEEQIRQELEIDWTASAAKRVYPQFGQIHIGNGPLRADLRSPFYCGWDFGQTPAFVLTQLNRYGQWLILAELVGPPDRATGIHEFGGQVADLLYRKLCVPAGLLLREIDLIHFGDPAGNARPARGGGHAGSDKVEIRSAYQILRDGLEVELGRDEDGEAKVERRPGWGWIVKPGAIAIAQRLEAVRARLTMLRDGNPMLVVDPACTAIIEGFMGAYHYRQRQDGQYELDPEKNWWSHPHDAVQYCGTRLFAPPRPLDDEDEEPAPTFTSQAHGRW